MLTLRTEELIKRFASQLIVDRVSLNMGPEIHVVIGLNGSGKSTLLKTVAGLLRPDAGCVCINGRDITKLPPEDRYMGYVAQHPALFPHMNVEANIRYGLRNGRGSEQNIGRLVDMLDLHEVLHKKPKTLSGGYQSRVSLARTLASQPQAILLDEPLSDLDRFIKEKLIPRFRDALRDLAAPVLYVTHDPLEARLLGDRFYAMVRGVLVEASSAEEAFDQIGAKVV